MTNNQIRDLTAGYSVTIDAGAWNAIGRLSSETFISIRDRLVSLASLALDGPGVTTGGNEVQKVMTAHVAGRNVTFRIDFSQKLVVLVSIESP
jgi:hypothetical protein